MKPLSFDFEQSLGAAVAATARSLRLAMTAELEPFGITYSQWVILVLLVKRGRVHQNEIAERAQLRASTVCRILDGMERDGWVRRVPCPDDGRQKRIVLQPKIKPVWAELRRIAHRVRRRALTGIPSEEYRALLRTLQDVRSNLTESDAAGAAGTRAGARR